MHHYQLKIHNDEWENPWLICRAYDSTLYFDLPLNQRHAIKTNPISSLSYQIIITTYKICMMDVDNFDVSCKWDYHQPSGYYFFFSEIILTISVEWNLTILAESILFISITPITAHAVYISKHYDSSKIFLFPILQIWFRIVSTRKRRAHSAVSGVIYSTRRTRTDKSFENRSHGKSFWVHYTHARVPAYTHTILYKAICMCTDKRFWRRFKYYVLCMKQ